MGVSVMINADWYYAKGNARIMRKAPALACQKLLIQARA
jgi:hypothetical protein